HLIRADRVLCAELREGRDRAIDGVVRHECEDRRGDQRRPDQRPAPGEMRRSKTPPTAYASSPSAARGLGDQLGTQAVLEAWVRFHGRTRRANSLGSLEQLGLVVEQVLELGIEPSAHPGHQRCSSTATTMPRRRRTPIIPRWMSSLTAPSLLPRISPIWASLRSSPSFRVIAALCWGGRSSIAAQTRAASALSTTRSSTGRAGSATAMALSRLEVGLRLR